MTHQNVEDDQIQTVFELTIYYLNLKISSKSQQNVVPLLNNEQQELSLIKIDLNSLNSLTHEYTQAYSLDL